jgi:arginine/lysine/ornithine decarboxylase
MACVDPDATRSISDARESRRTPHECPFAFATHSTSSIPTSTLIASNDVGTSMMDGPGGSADTQDVTHEAAAAWPSLQRRPHGDR